MPAEPEDRYQWLNRQAPGLDPRTTLARPDAADAHLSAKLNAERFLKPTTKTVSSGIADLRREPRDSAPLLTQALMGEKVLVLDEARGWAFCQLSADRYVGYLKSEALTAHGPEPTHLAAQPLSHVYPKPDLKAPPVGRITMGAAITIHGGHEENGFSEARGLGWVYTGHIAPLGAVEPDYVKTALAFQNAPYLWGGKTALGLDCSGLVQLVLARAGIPCPRDTDQQRGALGHSKGRETDACEKGDLVFFPGHVGFMIDHERLLHANATYMRVTINRLETVAGWLARDHEKPILDIRAL